MSDEPLIVRARVPGCGYDIVVQPGLLSAAGPRLRALSASRKAVVISDDRVAPLHLPALSGSLRASAFEVISATIPAGEDHKTIESAARLYDQLLPAGVDRSTPVLALGGGVVGDLSGFVAATTLRGLPFVQIPTTLLSMVDASVGGKTGVNHSVGKNLIGAFHQPVLVLIDTATLRTLPSRELRSGLAECIKHEIIRDAEGLARLEQSIDKALSLDVGYLSDLVAHNVAIKARVVEQDPFERGERAHLNFGHTFGHAIESVSQYAYAHGECVALGMVAACRMAARLGMFDEGSCERVVRLISKAGLPTGGMTLPVGEVCAAMLFDKKVKGGRVRFILPDRIGHVVIRDDVPEELVREAVESLR
jgi:3-dehydroquinate synthase